MDDDSKQKSNSFDAALPLPNKNDRPADQNAAADLIRKKVAAAYANEPDIEDEEEALESAPQIKKSKHQEFIEQLMLSGKPLHEIQTDWHDYYQSLSDLEKHEVWQEFYSVNSAAQRSSEKVAPLTPEIRKKPLAREIVGTSHSISPKTREAAKKEKESLPAKPRLSVREGLHSLVFGLGVGMMVLVILLFSFFNERFIAPLIQPSRHVNNIPLITSGDTIGNQSEVIIPKINVEIPVIYGVDTIDDKAVDKALEQGVVHYADTAMPGQNGNLVIVGHSSNNILNPGKYKFAFVLLSRLDIGDTFYIQKDGKRYTYQVYKKRVVSPSDVSVLGPAEKTATASLITCDPPGTSINRLVVTGEQISPDPIANAPAGGQNTIATSTKIIPGNSPSLWNRLWSWL